MLMNFAVKITYYKIKKKGLHMANGPITPSTWTVDSKIKQVQYDELNTAIARLEQLKKNIQNCNCSPSNCCQSKTCQTCQDCQTCQECQTSVCQSDCTCQSCQVCQTCNSCVRCKACVVSNCS